MRFRIGLVRIPDLSFVSAERLKAAGGVRQAIPSLIPDLAIEVLRTSNRPAEMRLKRGEYFGAGVRLVWIIDPKRRVADVYTSADARERINPEGMLRGLDVLPGFEIRLSELFAAADQAIAGQ
jgi:Uma2 family endonuclease